MRRSIFFLTLLAIGLRPAIAQDVASDQHDVLVAPEHAFVPPPFDQQHIEIDVLIDPDERSVAGYASLHVRPLEPLERLVLHAADMVVDSVFVESNGLRFRAPFQQTGSDSLVITLSPMSAATPDDATSTFSVGDSMEVAIADSAAGSDIDSLDSGLVVDPIGVDTTSATIDQPFIVTTYYVAKPTMGLYFVPPSDDEQATLTQVWSQGEVEGNRHWIPVYDHPSDKLTVELTATMDSAYTIISNGALVFDRVNDDGTRSVRYAQLEPHSPYLISIAADDYQPTRTSVTLSNGKRIPITYWALPEQVADVERTLGRTPEMLTYFNDLLGVSYPWHRYDQVFVRDFMWGGMENTGATTLTDQVLIDERASLQYDPDRLVAHELAHQWFGNLVTARDWSEVWLQEAFASHLAAMDLERTRGREAYLLHLDAQSQTYLHEASTYVRPLVWNRWSTTMDLFDRHAYVKGNWVLHMLRLELGEETFARVLKHFLTEHAFGSFTTLDFQEVAEQISGRPLDTFFDQWVYAAGHPILDFQYTYDAGAGKLRVVITQTQESALGPDAFRFPLTLEIQTLGGAERHEVQISQRTHDFTFDVNMPPRFILPDPDLKVLAVMNVDQPASAWVAQLRQSLEPASRIRAARALTSFVDQPALLVGLRSALEAEPSAEVRREIIRTVGQIPNDQAKERLLLAASQDDNGKVREAAVVALGAFEGSTDVASRLMEIAHNEPSYAVQGAAVESLARIGASSARQVIESALITPSFRETVRKAAFRGLSHVDIPIQEGLRLATRYGAPGNPTVVRQAVAEYLGTLAPVSDRALNQLIDLLDDDTVIVRKSAIEALGKLTDPRAVEALEERRAVEKEPLLQVSLRKAIR